MAVILLGGRAAKLSGRYSAYRHGILSARTALQATYVLLQTPLRQVHIPAYSCSYPSEESDAFREPGLAPCDTTLDCTLESLTHIPGWLTNASIAFGGLFGFNGRLSLGRQFGLDHAWCDLHAGGFAAQVLMGFGLESECHVYHPLVQS